MFASVAIFPDMGISFFLLPVSIPGWIYALLYVLFSIYGIRSQKNNIGHDAHLGGALIGMILALIMNPSAFMDNYGKILIFLVPIMLSERTSNRRSIVSWTSSAGKEWEA